MKRFIHLAMLMLIGLQLVSCLNWKRKESTKVKKALRAKGGEWEVSQSNNYYINNGSILILTEDLGYIGEFEFTKDEGGNVPSTEAGTWTPAGGPKENILYSAFTDDVDEKTVTVVIYYNENGSWVSDGGNVVQDNYNKEDMIWESTTGITDTIIKHTYFLHNKGF